MYGLPERGGDSDLFDTENEFYRLYNVDIFKYNKNQYYGLYGSWPFILAKYSDNFILSGLIWNNPSETYLKLKTEKIYLETNNISSKEENKNNNSVKEKNRKYNITSNIVENLTEKYENHKELE